MTSCSELYPPAPLLPEIVDQALALLLKGIEDSGTGDKEGHDTMEPSIARLDRLAWYHQVAGEALQRAAQTRAALLRQKRNALIPINRLPSELLSAILIKSVDEHQTCRIKALQMLAQVAWQWWQTIKSDPQFWAHITPPMGSVELQIRKAGILPLCLDWPTSVDAIDHAAFRDLIQRHAGRWTDINIMGSRDGVVLQLLCTSQFPHLKYLEVHPFPAITSGDWKFNLARCQDLREAHLPIIPYFSPLPSSNIPEASNLLRLTPQLEELEVKNLYSDLSTQAPVDAPAINLPELRRLKFANAISGNSIEWVPLLAQVRAPQLEKLDLHYDLDPERWVSDLVGHTILDALVTRPLHRTEDAPLQSVLRKTGPFASWRVELCEKKMVIEVDGGGEARLAILMDVRYSAREDIPSQILLPPPAFALPVDLYAVWWDGGTDPEFWDEVLDRTPLLRSVILESSLHVARQVMDRLSTKASSSSSSSPRAPNLEKLCFPHGGIGSWIEGQEGGAVKAMLEKRRNIFVQGGTLDPRKLVVTGPRGLVFDEVECCWLGLNDV